MDITTFLIQCLNSVQYGLLLFLVASGLTLIFGIMGVINLAHGSFYMIGAYMAFTLTSLTGNFALALVLGLVLSVAFGYLLEWGFFSFLYEREHLMQVLMTYGLILVFEELRSILVGDDVHGVPVPVVARRRHRDRQRHELPGVSPLHLGRVPRGGGRHVLHDQEDAAGHDGARRLHQSRDGAVAGHQHLAALPAGVRRGSRTRDAGRHDRGAGGLGVSGHGHRRCSSSASWWW